MFRKISLGELPLKRTLAGLGEVLGRTAGTVTGKRRRATRTAVLVGHSHSKAIFDAAARQGDLSLSGFNFWTGPKPYLNDAQDAFHPKIARCLTHGTIFSAVGGAVHYVMGLVQHPEPFDFVLPGHADLPLTAGARLVPFAAIRDAVAAQLAEYHDIIGLVRSVAPERVFHLEPPPPLEDGDHMLADVPWEYLSSQTRMLSPASLRWKLWRLANDLTRAWCEGNDVVFVECPGQAIDAHGFLRSDLYLDPLHADATYGALVVDQMKELL